MQFAIPLSRRHNGPLFRQVYQGLREAILSGAFSSGQKLPSTRDMADQLGISRTVALLAYDQLLAEGFAVARGGSGTYVSEGVAVSRTAVAESVGHPRVSRFGAAVAAAWPRVDVPAKRPRPLRYDFAYGRSDIDTFPFEAWRRTLLRCARQAAVSDLDYGTANGHPALREAISAHLRRSRAVVSDSSQVIVVSGSQQALDLIARVLLERGDRVAIEDPGYQGTREVLRAAGARLVAVPVDDDGLNPARLPSRARLAFVTPSHQFPTGATLALPRRVELLAWAKRGNALIVEDDYDGELRYDGQPLESLQSLDREGHVIYIGTFSRTIFSALRLGYLIVPKALVPAFTAAKWLCDRHTATLEQHTLAEFITGGMYERYLRRLRRRTAVRRRVLLDSIGKHLRERVRITGDGAGAHVVLWPRGRRGREEALVTRAAARGVGIYGISPYFQNRPTRTGFLLGYSRLTEADIREGIRLLGEVL